MDRQNGRQIDRMVDRQIEWQIDICNYRQKDRYTYIVDRKIDKKIDRKKEREKDRNLNIDKKKMHGLIINTKNTTSIQASCLPFSVAEVSED